MPKPGNTVLFCGSVPSPLETILRHHSASVLEKHPPGSFSIQTTTYTVNAILRLSFTILRTERLNARIMDNNMTDE